MKTKADRDVYTEILTEASRNKTHMDIHLYRYGEVRRHMEEDNQISKTGML